MMDWRIGRYVRSVPHPSSGGAGSITLAPNQQRVGIWFGGTGVIDPITGYSPEEFLITSGAVFVMRTNLSQVMSLQTHGDLVTKGMTIQGFLNAGAIYIVEFFMSEEYLATAMKEFDSNYRYPK